MSQPDMPQAPERLPNEPYYQQQPLAQPQASQRRRWGRLLVTIGLVWLAITLVGNGPWFGGFPFAPSRTVDRAVDGSRLSLSTDSDDVVLAPSSDGRFHIHVSTRGFGNSGSDEELLRRAGVQVSSESGEVRVSSGNRGFQLGNFGVELRVEVPKGAPATIETSSGDITAEDLAGDITFNTSSGDVNLNDIQGRLSVSTSSGDVRLRDGRVAGATINTGSGDVDLHGVSDSAKIATSSGDISLRDASNITVDLQSSSGGIRFEGVLADKSSSLLKTSSGDLSLRVGNSPLAITHTTVSGDAEIEVETQSGATPSLQLTTNSGNIEVKPLD